MAEMTLTQLARESDTREREINRIVLWSEDGLGALRRALLKRGEKEPLVKHVEAATAYLRAAQRELAALSKELKPIVGGEKK